MSKGFASSYRIVLLAIGLFACFGALGVRLVWLHVVEREALLQQVAKQRHAFSVKTAKRGDILDSRGVVLATSRSLLELGVDPISLRAKDEHKWPQLARLIGMPEAELRRIFNTKYSEAAPRTPAPPAATTAPLVFNLTTPVTPSPRVASAAGDAATDHAADDGVELEPDADERGRRAIRWVKLRDDVPESLYAAIRSLGIQGVYGTRAYRRAYPNNQLAAHLIGFVNRDQQAVTGIEYHADFYLRGQNGWSVGERDGRQRELAQFSIREVPPTHGYHVVLSINSAVQDIIERELAQIAVQFAPKKATIIVSDPASGFILGLGNYPSYNLNEYNKVPADEQARMRNVAVADVYEPGSVFKIVAVAAALEEGLVTPYTRFNCTDETVEYLGRTLRLPREDHGFGQDELTVAEILSRSSNRGSARLGMELGAARLHEYALAFGFGRRLGFPVGGEVAGILAPPEKWVPIDVTRIPMGHSIASTALQMHQGMSVIASGGVLLRPQIVKQIRDASGAVVFHRKDGIELNRVVSARTAETVAAMLMTVASSQGTAAEAAIEGFDVAGKTGTTQKLEEVTLANGDTKLVYSSRHHIASFVGFFPAGRPQVAISVIVDEASMGMPGRIAYGRAVAAPSFKRVGEQLIPILDIKPSRTIVRPNFAATGGEGRR